MRPPLPLLLLASVAAVIRAADDSWLALPDLTRCGGKEQFVECHVEPACLYGERSGRESPIFLRRFYAAYHPAIDIAKSCKTIVVVSSVPPSPDDKDSGDYFLDLPRVVKVRTFNASGWVHPAHFAIGVRFIVGQKIVMVQADDGFTDDDDWVYGSEGKFPVFNATLDHKETTRNGAKTIRVSVKAQAHDGHRYYKYERPYRRGQPADRGYFGMPELEKPNEEEEEAQEAGEQKKPEAAELRADNISPAGTAISTPPLFTTIVCSAGAAIATGAMAWLVYSLVVKKRRDAERALSHAPPTWSSSERDVLIVDQNGEIRTVTARSP